MSVDDPNEYMTVAEVADLLRVPKATVTHLLTSGQLPGIRLSVRRGWRIRRSDVDTLIGKQQQQKGDKA
jgi:excisionase family DNA binding protein